MSFRTDRLTAIEAKKAKLEELRRQRESKRLLVASGNDNLSVRKGIDESVDKLVEQLTQTVSSEVGSSDNDMAAGTIGITGATGATGTLAASSSSSSSFEKSNQENKANYVSVSVQVDDLKPTSKKNETITYNKGTQTVDLNPEVDDLADSTWDNRAKKTQEELENELREKLSLQIREELSRERGKKDNHESAKNTIRSSLYTRQIDEDKLIQFIGNSMRVIDRSLSQDDRTPMDLQDGTQSGLEDDFLENQSLKLKAKLHHELITNKSVTSIDWSPSGLLIAVSYSKLPPSQAISSHEPNRGIIIIWNAKLCTPEYIFTASTEILTVKFLVNTPTRIVAGGYSGRIFQYDINSISRLPILQSSLFSRGHSYPVFTILQVNTSLNSKNIFGGGNNNGGTLVTISTDGKICQWSPFVLDKPINSSFKVTDTVITAIRINNGILLGGDSLSLIDNFQRKTAKPFGDLRKFITGLSHRYSSDINSENYDKSRILCTTFDSIYIYSENGVKTNEFRSSSVIMDGDWLSDDKVLAISGTNLEIFDTTQKMAYASFSLDIEGKYLNKVKVNKDLVSVGTEDGYLYLYEVL
ncbi:hypothetical protein PACTADRAFT_3297 [Pachysolen tannophilus NRRL Y-2460]|uniref:Uncharacterized protein n=1 Tax=Pachysolen tannophilus NRRL Y-2460 TaxID=669874 RepID=A0A1E4TV51_PACTA|nr:hypothetical protein PACTADRAFT_3297 [Pachysolen tannophilus NRRL Y-2460]